MPTEHFNMMLGFSYHISITDQELEMFRKLVADPKADYGDAVVAKCHSLLQSDLETRSAEVMADEAEYPTEPYLTGDEMSVCADCEDLDHAMELDRIGWVTYLQAALDERGEGAWKTTTE